MTNVIPQISKRFIKLLGSLWHYLGNILSTAYYGTSLIGDDPQLPLSNLVLVIAVILWIALLVVWFRKKSPDRLLIFVSPSTEIKVHYYSRKIRSFALTLFCLLPLLILFLFLYTPKNDELLITVSLIDGKDHDFEITQFIVRELREDLDTLSNIKIEIIDSVINEHQGSVVAKEIASAHGSDIFIWGWYSKTQNNVSVTINTEFLNPAIEEYNEIKYFSHKEEVLPISGLNSFSFQFDLADQIRLFSNLFIGEIKLRGGELKDAEKLFSKVLNDSLINRYLDSKAHTYALRSVCRKKLAIKLEKEFTYDKDWLLKYYDKYWPKALNDIDSALTYNASNYSYLCHKLNIQIEFNESDDYSDAIHTANYAIILNPSGPEPYFCRGVFYKRLRNYPSAIYSFSKAISLDSSVFIGYHDRGITYYNMGEYDKAIKDLTVSLSIYPYALTYFVRSQSYLEIGDTNSSEMDLHKTLSLAPKYKPAINRLASINYDRNKIEKSIDLANNVISLSSTSVEFYNTLLEWDWIRSDDRSAKDVYLKDYIIANVILSRCYNKLTNFDKALNHIHICIDYYPEVITYKLIRLEIYSDMNRLELAFKEINGLIKMYPHDVFLCYTRATLYEKIGDYNSALKDYKQVIFPFNALSDSSTYNNAVQRILELKKKLKSY